MNFIKDLLPNILAIITIIAPVIKYFYSTLNKLQSDLRVSKETIKKDFELVNLKIKYLEKDISNKGEK